MNECKPLVGGLPPRPRCTHAEESRGNTGHCDLSLHRNAYTYKPEAGDPDEGQGLTLFHFSAQCKRFLWDWVCI